MGAVNEVAPIKGTGITRTAIPSLLPGARNATSGASPDAGKGLRLPSVRVAVLLIVVLMCSHGSVAYSVLTHEEIVDLLWTDKIQPLLLKRFPGLSEEIGRASCRERV